MSSPAYRLAPWPSVVRAHRDVREGELDMGTYAVNLARVYRQAGGVPEVYARPARFFATTYLTLGLGNLLRDVWGSLAGAAGDRVLQLRTPFGGGKTHTLVALLHLARDRAAAVAAMADLANLPDPGPVRVAVLSGEELDPLSVTKASGIETQTLWGELAAQLRHYELVADHDADGSAPGGERLAQVLGDGPVLILLDEVLTYVEKAMAVPRG
jgi:predicted AAA+ superfamily ATPase